MALASRPPEPSTHAIALIGRMETETVGAQLALAGVQAVLDENSPSSESVNRIMIGRDPRGPSRARGR